MSLAWHTLSLPEVEKSQATNFHSGLNKTEVDSRLKSFGLNKLPEGKTESIFAIFLRQFQSSLIYILLLAAVAVFFIGDRVDGYIIVFVLFFNAVVGTIQEGKAQNTLLALKKFSETKATVLRDNSEIIVSDEEVAPGDIVILQEGDKVPADARVIRANNLKINESALTGESEPVYKTSETMIVPSLPVAEQRNMVFKGTYVVAGNGAVAVVGTGIETIIGKISKKIESINVEIPLKADIKNLSKLIIYLVSAISILLFVLGTLEGKGVKEMFATVVALSVSIIPEGLPIVFTLVLATGVWRMARRNALVKKLHAVEALGQANVIAVDKTGTITKNEMVAREIFVNGKFFEIGGAGYDPTGIFFFMGEDGQKQIVSPADCEEILLIGKISALTVDAKVVFSDEKKEWQVSGDPTEAALSVFARKTGFKKEELESAHPFLRDIPFDYKKKYHASLHEVDGKGLFTAVGAPEAIFPFCKKIWRNGKELKLTNEAREQMDWVFRQMLEGGLRVLALAIKKDVKIKEKDFNLSPDKAMELTFVGFCGIQDTLRHEVKDAIAKTREAGIEVVMITGDHRITAKAVAREAGIWQEGDKILDGYEIDKMNEEEFSQSLDGVSVFARVTPEHKLKIIQAYKQQGKIIAMTGDGVNDAPSLVAADLGVAMGKAGTEVAKEASDIVLLDDNFGTITAAIEEGRNIYQTLKKVILYLFSTSMGEVFAIAGALFIGLPLPILAGQIIWLNLVTDGFLDVALAMEPNESNLIRDNHFKRPKRLFVDMLMAQRMLLMSAAMMIGTLFLFQRYADGDIVKAWTVSLTVLAVFLWFNAWNCRSEKKSLLDIDLYSNKFLLVATGIIVSLQIFAVYNPVMQKILHTSPLTFSEWMIIAGVAFSIIILEEIRKAVYRWLEKSYTDKALNNLELEYQNK